MKLSYTTSIYSLLTVLTVGGCIEAIMVNRNDLIKSMGFYALYLLITFLLVFAIRDTKLNLKYPRERKLYYIEGFTNKQIAFFSIFGSTLFFYFLLSNISEFGIIQLAIFSEEYRNSVYKGSGIYTVVMIIVVPLILAYNVALGLKINYIFLVAASLLFVCVTITGLRIYLAPLLLAFLFRFSRQNIPVIKIVLMGLIVIFLFALVKFFLDSASDNEQGYIGNILNPLIRLHIPYLLSYDFGYGVDNIGCAIPFFHYLGECASEEIKYALALNNNNIQDGFKTLSKYSGIAIPLPVFLYNTFGFFSVPFLALYLIALNNFCVFITKKENSILAKILILGLVFNMSSALLEDYIFLRSVDQILILSFVVIMIKKYIENKSLKLL